MLHRYNYPSSSRSPPRRTSQRPWPKYMQPKVRELSSASVPPAAVSPWPTPKKEVRCRVQWNLFSGVCVWLALSIHATSITKKAMLIQRNFGESEKLFYHCHHPRWLIRVIKRILSTDDIQTTPYFKGSVDCCGPLEKGGPPSWP